jgi:hypothetical protein
MGADRRVKPEVINTARVVVVLFDDASDEAASK